MCLASYLLCFFYMATKYAKGQTRRLIFTEGPLYVWMLSVDMFIYYFNLSITLLNSNCNPPWYKWANMNLKISQISQQRVQKQRGI